MNNYNEVFKRRTKALALEVLRLYKELPLSDEVKIIGKQLVRSATSVAANYRAVVLARSARERFAKLCIVLEEADETLFWLELLEEGHYVTTTRLSNIKTETNEIVKVMSAYRLRYKVGR